MIKIQNINKLYGQKIVLEDISFDIKIGKPLALIGQNGVGKSTLIKIILGVINPDNSSYNIDIPSNINVGYLPEERGVYKNESVEEHLRYFSSISGFKLNKENLDIFLEKFQLQSYRKLKAGELSKGNAQKLQLAISLVNDPDFIILDEPFSGLDPINRKLFFNILNEYKTKKYILFSSHQFDQIDDYCEEILILKDGKNFFNGTKKMFKETFSKSVLYLPIFEGYKDKLNENSIEYKVGGDFIQIPNINNLGDLAPLIKVFPKNIKEIRLQSETLENLYLKIMEE